MRYITLLLTLAALTFAQQWVTCNEHSYLDVETKTIEDLEAFNLSWARCELKRGEIEKAMSAYERVLLINPSNIDATLELLSLYNRLQMLDEAKALRASLENMQLTPSQRRLLATLRQSDFERVNLRAKLGFNMGYDSNINFLPNSNIIGSMSAKSSAISNSEIGIDIKYDLSQQGGLGLVTSLLVSHQSTYMDHQYDFLYSGMDVGMSYDGDNFSLVLPLKLSDIYYLQRNLLNQFGAEPTLTVALSNAHLLAAEFKYLMSRYIEASDSNRDVDIVGGSLGYYYLSGKDFYYIEGEYEDYSPANERPLPFTQRENLYMRAGLNYTFSKTLTTRLDYQYITTLYQSPIAPSSQTKRSDNLHNIALTLSVPISKNLNLESVATYYDNSSNYALAEYEKSSLTLGVIYNY